MKKISLTAIVGAVIGLLLFNLVGAIIGAFIGLMIDKRAQRNTAQNAEIFHRQVTNLAEIIGSLLRRSGNATTSNINDAKTLFIEEISKTYPFLDAHEIASSIDRAATDRNFDDNVSINSLRNTFALTSESRSAIYFITIVIYVYCNAVRTHGDQHLYDYIFALGTALGIPHPIIMVLLARSTDFGQNGNRSGSWSDSYYTGGGSYNNDNSYQRNHYNPNADTQKELQEAYKILGVDENVTKEELRKVKRRLLAKWHPDKAPDGKKDEYTEMSQKINAAIDLITVVKGF